MSESDIKKVAKGDAVSVHYTGKFENGEVFDSSINSDPLSFKVGAGQMIPGFDEGVLGMVEGEKKTVEIPPEKAYGIRDPSLEIPVPKQQIVDGIGKVPELGTPLQMTISTGGVLEGYVTEITDDTIKVDFNHRLAGKKLIFEIELISHVKPGN